MDKRIFYISAGILAVTLVILVMVSVFLNSRNQRSVSSIYPQPEVTSTQNSNGTIDGNEIAETVVPSKDVTPEIVADNFYQWYITTPNPLGSGQYLTNPNLSDEFKETIKGFVNRGDHLVSDPILTCPGIVSPKKVSLQGAVYDPSKLHASIILREDKTDAVPLYEILMSNINEKWLVEDVRCTI